MSAQTAAITIRSMDSSDADRRALTRLAELDSGVRLTGRVLGLEVAGTVLAAIEVATGRVVADPFSRTKELLGLLELRAAQLRERRGDHKRRRGERLLGRRSRPALGGSPPGQIVSMPRWS